jgi:precorrin-2 C20-methyltransferase/precorrin-3B C17-methyltransferase
MSQFCAVGVGPGDPELLTLKAVAVLRIADAIYHAGPSDRAGRAWEVIRALVRPEQVVRRVLTVPMDQASAADDWRAPYRAGVERIVGDCRRGLKVAFVTEGDPTLYSTASYVWQLLSELAPDIAIEVVPGVTSLTAAAARVRWPLARRHETLRVVPAVHHAADLASLVGSDAHTCLLKPGPALPLLLDIMASQRGECEGVYVENLGSEREWITHDLAQAVGRDGYFSLVLLRRPQPTMRSRPEEEPRLPGGKVSVIGIGPGSADLLTGQALRALQGASDLVGYSGYLNYLDATALRGRRHPFPLGSEIERARLALDLARQGRQVALVSSGDAGVYGMASVLLESVTESPALEVEIIPGVTAATAAAACLGAPLGHDFACISLSDLLTPWSIVERRLEAAGQGDFVVVLYNPASRQRTWQLPRARDLLLRHRPSTTPVGLVHGAYRQGMRVWFTTLGQLTTDNITMETTVIVGSSRTQLIHGRMVTPRGYRVAGGEWRAAEEERVAGGGWRAAGEDEVAGACGNDMASQAAEAPNSDPATRHPSPVTCHPPRATRHAPPPAPLGQRIMEDSFAIIEGKLGQHALQPWAFAVVRRMIHASADFDFAGTLRHSTDFESVIQTALAERTPVVTDTEMVLEGVRSIADRAGLALACYLNDPAAAALSAAQALTRSAAGVRVAAERHDRPLLVIGNAPTAVEEALRLIEQEGWRPAAVVAIPVGFVGVEEAKQHLMEQTRVPYLTCVGRKGGSAVTAAAVNALLERYLLDDPR